MIDAVLTWVDGSDPRLQAKQARYLPGPSASANAAATRFASCDEIFYALASLLRFAPWLNRIHIVTDAQTPDVFDRLGAHFGPAAAARIGVVDHRAIFRGHETFLPSFNSRGIETMLHRIPGLAPRYLYLNDDFFLLRPTVPEDFFSGDHLVIRGRLRPAWPIVLRRALREMTAGLGGMRLFERASSKEGQANAARLLGHRSRYLWHDHTPHPFIRARMEAVFAAHPDWLRQNIAPRIRDHRQFGIAALSYGLDRQAGNRAFRPTELLYLQPAGRRDVPGYLARKFDLAARTDPRFACIQSLDRLSGAERATVLDWLAARILPGPAETRPETRPGGPQEEKEADDARA
jgi:hypothetical protein